MYIINSFIYSDNFFSGSYLIVENEDSSSDFLNSLRLSSSEICGAGISSLSLSNSNDFLSSLNSSKVIIFKSFIEFDLCKGYTLNSYAI